MLARWKGAAFLLFAVSLQGCSVGPLPSGATSKSPQSLRPFGPLDFSWKLSGDRSVAPVQVFSDATHTWLQWQANQTLPAIFGINGASEQLLAYERSGPYTRLEGHWVALLFRGAHLQARARRVEKITSHPVTTTETVPTVSSPVSPNLSEPEPLVKPIKPIPSVHTGSQAFYAITNSDKNLRQALSRWANLSGWKFQTEHWAVDVDIPLTATANFSEDFIASVRALIEATELSERPLQPCFYANQVLRVVPITEVCDRTVVEGGRT